MENRLENAILASQNSLENNGIGRLAEKNLHSVLKYYFEPNEENHEIKIAGYYADIANSEGITEIQTAGFGKLRPKLEVFLPSWKVNVVYPVAQTKYLNWINPETGDISSRRKSPKKGNVYEIFKELVYIKNILPNENLYFSIVLLDVDEYKLLDGFGQHKKIRASKHERLPITVNEVLTFCSTSLNLLLPEGLPCVFSTKDFKALTGVTPRVSCAALNVLRHIGDIDMVGKKGNLILYERAD